MSRVVGGVGACGGGDRAVVPGFGRGFGATVGGGTADGCCGCLGRAAGSRTPTAGGISERGLPAVGIPCLDLEVDLRALVGREVGGAIEVRDVPQLPSAFGPVPLANRPGPGDAGPEARRWRPWVRPWPGL